MKYILAVICFCALVFANPQPPHGHVARVSAVVVDLDAEPQDRWAHIVKPLAPQIQPIISYVKSILPPAVFELLDQVLGKLDEHLGKPWADEVRGIAAATGFDLGEIVLMNLFYDLHSACTSIVAQTGNGSIIHGRNLDYSLPNLQNITIKVNFTRNDHTVYETTTYAGYVGALTGMKYGTFSVSLDQRHTNATIVDNIREALFRGGNSIGFTLRQALEHNTTFEDAVAYLSTVHLMSVEYIILGGVTADQGAVITRERDAAVDVWRLQSPRRWYLVETNYDHWKPVPGDDDRRGPANKFLQQYNSSTITVDHLAKLLNTFPNLNAETTYTTLMSAATGYYRVNTQNNP